MKLFKRTISMLLALVLIVGMMPGAAITASATETDEIDEIPEFYEPEETPPPAEPEPDEVPAPEDPEPVETPEPNEALEVPDTPEAPEPSEVPETTVGTEPTEAETEHEEDTADETAEEMFTGFMFLDDIITYNYRIYYYANYAGCSEYSTIEIDDAEAEIVELNVSGCPFSRDGYTFLGWSTSSGGGVSYGPGSTVTLTAENNILNLYAVWQEIPKTTYDYVVTYHSNYAGGPDSVSDSENQLGSENAAVLMTADGCPFSRPNATFLGWATSPSGDVSYNPGSTLTLTKAAPSLDLYAVWDVQEIEAPTYDYSVTYHANFAGASPASASDNENVTGTEATSFEMTADSCPFSRPGYTFQGWAASAGGSVAYSVGSVISLTRDNTSAELYAVWQEIPQNTEYEVWFMDGSRVHGYAKVKADKSAPFPADPDVNDGNHEAGTYFVGWFTDDGVQYTTATPITGNTTLHARYELMQYTVSFNGNGGVLDAATSGDRIISHGTSIGTLPAAPTFEGHTFTGWIDSNGAAVTSETSVTSNMTVFASWKETPKPTYDYSITYHANFEGANPAIAADNENVTGTGSTYADFYVDECHFSREGHKFLGWATSATGGVVYEVNAIVTLPAQMPTLDLYAVWEEIVTENPTYDFSIIYKANFADANPAVKADSENLTDTEETSVEFTVDSNSFANSGYTFKGWSTKATGAVEYVAGDTVTLTAEKPILTLYAVWEAIPTYSYSITYHANFEGANPSVKADYENVSDIEFTSIEMHTDGCPFVREGYAFQGWATKTNGEVEYAANAVVTLTKDAPEVDLYAVWEEAEKPTYDYSLIYNANYPGADPAEMADAENVTGSEATSLKVCVDSCSFVREGYTFQGWALSAVGKVVYAPNAGIFLTSENPALTLYAVWEQNTIKPTYSYGITYHVSFENAESVSWEDSENVTDTEASSMEFTIDGCAYTQEGYTFQGWTTKAKSNEVIQAGSTITLTPDSPTLELAAVWEKDEVEPGNDYKITYHANYADAFPAFVEDSENISGTESTSADFTIDGCAFTRKGYSFQGWATKPNGKVKHQEGDTVTLTDKEPTMDLYAVWAPNTYTITFNANGGRCRIKSTEVTFGSHIGRLPTPTKHGFTFAGWYTPEGRKITNRSIYSIAGDITLKAKWTEKTDTHKHSWTDNPKTGDDSHIVLLSCITGISLISMAGLGFYFLSEKKKAIK